MKKFVNFILIIVLVLTSAGAVYANQGQKSEPGGKIVYQAKEIKDLDTLFKRAKDNITDLETGKYEAKPIAKLKNKLTGNEKNVETYTTTQLLKKEILDNGKERKSYATTGFAEVTISVIKSRTDDGVEDIQDSVRAYSTIYWEEEDNGVQLQSATGGWQFTNNGNTSMSDLKVVLGQAGFTIYGPYEQYYSSTYSVSSTWTKYASSSWDPVVDNAFDYVGATQQAKISEIYPGDDEWYFIFVNQINDTQSRTETYPEI